MKEKIITNLINSNPKQKTSLTKFGFCFYIIILLQIFCARKSDLEMGIEATKRGEYQKMSKEEPTEETENKKTMDLMKKAFRWPKFGVAQKLVSQHLVLATFSTEPKIVIEHVCMAASMVEGLGQKVEGLDFEQLRGIVGLNRSFQNHVKTILL